MSAATASSAPPPPRAAPRLWILGPARDLLLFVGTPLLLLPLVFAANHQWSWTEIGLFVAAFGALGHHLPGMMRAYGDRQLFARFRLRFTVAPVLLAGLCLFSSHQGLRGIFLAAYTWGLWHAMMQTYGFMRIYDSKVGSFSPRTSYLDLAMCFGWFGTGILLSPVRLGALLDYAYECSVPFVSGAALQTFQQVWVGGTLLLTGLYIIHAIREARAGRPMSPIKLALMVSSFGFWWIATVSLTHMLVGVALWELFHDVQYLSIVWIFNRGRVDREPDVGGFTRFLFRRSGALVGAYLGLIFAYGYLGWLSFSVKTPAVARSLEALLVTSGILHFYFDGFIWKVRDRATRDSLAVATEGAEAAPPADWARGTAHALRWTLLLGLPIALLTYGQTHRSTSDVDRYRTLVEALPSYTEGHYRLGLALRNTGAIDEALASIHEALRLQPDHQPAAAEALLLEARQSSADPLEHYARATWLDPRNVQAHYWLGVTLAAQNRPDDAERALREALARQPDYADAHLALGLVLARRGEARQGIDHAVHAAALRPGSARIQAHLAELYQQSGDSRQALAHYETAVQLAPGDSSSRVRLAELLTEGGRPLDALAHYQWLLEHDPADAGAHAGLAATLRKLGRFEEALAEYRRAQELDPEDANALFNLSYMLSAWPTEGLGNAEEAVQLAESFSAIMGTEHPLTLDLLGMALAQAGRLDDAIAHGRRAVAAYEEHGAEAEAADARTRLQAYESSKPFRSPEPTWFGN